MRIFTIVGIILAVAGAGLLVYSFTTHSTDPFDIGPSMAGTAGPILLFIGVIFTIVGVYVGRLLGNTKKLLAEGVPGTASIISVSDTGVYINERPMAKMELQVNVPGRPPYVVEHNEVIPFVALGMITPGSMLPVAVDPQDPHKLAIDWSGQTRMRATGPSAATPMGASSSAMPLPNTLSTGATMGVVPNTLGNSGAAAVAPPLSTNVIPGTVMTAGAAGLSAADLSQVMQELNAAGINIDPNRLANATVLTTPTVTIAGPGVTAGTALGGSTGRAVIRDAQDLGVQMGGQKLYKFSLDVTPPGGSTYATQAAGPVPPDQLGRAVAGTTVDVFIDPSNQQNVTLDWSA
jgi:hypothetical protein